MLLLRSGRGCLAALNVRRLLAMGRLTCIALHLVLASGLMVACGSEDPKVAEARKEAEDTDREVADDLAGPNHAEAREWLRRPTALGFKVSVDEMRQMTDELYAAGATTVYVTGIEEFQGRELAAILVVQLPAAEAPRRNLFEWEGAFAKATDSEPARDVGQKYLKIILD
jgi:hypothetical protein